MKTKLLIFGITGDLGTRKLLPAINQIVKTGEFNGLEVIGVSRRHFDVAQLLEASLGVDNNLSDRTTSYTMSLSSVDDYWRLKEYLALSEDDQLLIYLSVPPLSAPQIVDFLGESGINTPNVKIMFEKPFGINYDSAVEVIGHTERYFNECQIYRIDHYLAKEMAQNIVAFRGGNAIFSRLWNKDSIERIEVLALETLGIEGRAQFYEQTGALRDVVQGHLMQLLALAIMDIPHNFDWTTLSAQRLDALEQLEVADPQLAVRAQYDGYEDEVNNHASMTETYVSLQLKSNAPEWQGVPLILTTGKSMNEKTTEIRVYLRKAHEAQSNCIKFRIQPNEGVEIDLFTKKPGYEREFVTKELKFNYPEDTKLPDAYEQVIVDAIRSHKSLFTSGKEVLRSWEILKPVQDAWNADDASLKNYAVGSTPQDIWEGSWLLEFSY